MIGLYYRSVIIGDLKDTYAGETYELSQILHDHIVKNNKSYGLSKGKIIHVYINEDMGLYTSELINIRRGKSYPSNLFSVSSFNINDVTSYIESILKLYTNTIVFFVAKDVEHDESVKSLCGRLGIKRKSNIPLEYRIHLEYKYKLTTVL